MASNHICEYDLNIGFPDFQWLTKITRPVDPMVVPADVVAQVGKSPSASVKIDEEKEGGYVFTLEVFHQLHCLVCSVLDYCGLKSEQGTRINDCRMCCGWLRLAIIMLASILPLPPLPQSCVSTLVGSGIFVQWFLPRADGDPDHCIEVSIPSFSFYQNPTHRP